MAIVRQHVRVRGIVQGVGFRPFVFALATRRGLRGHVANDAGGVSIVVEGDETQLRAFCRALETEAPPLARVESVDVVPLDREDPLPEGEPAFRILASHAASGVQTPVSADIATCAECLRELRDPRDRRHGYPFVNCTNCGPRYTIIVDTPYDRARTTMASFAMCPECRAEYDSPTNRRFHAQPNACPACGPRLRWREGGAGDSPASGAPLAADDALLAACAMLRAGGIVAVKGIGGFHLACDATDSQAVRRLRQRKRRPDKPLALLVADLAGVMRLAHCSAAEEALLQSAARPIVLLTRRSDGDPTLAPEIAPGQSTLGIMLPYSPLHHLLSLVGPLVMTSGNLSDEPIVRDDAEAIERLGGIADGFLLHDRPIHVVCDDSVSRSWSGGELPLRRSRGHAPYPVRLAAAVPHILAVGGELKATACLTRDRYAYLTPHIGDVGNPETMAAMERACDHLERLFRVTPSRVACDLHPGYLSSRWAREVAATRGIPVVGVQHHHAHLAALLAEHGLGADARVLAFTFDGTGYGTDGSIWGGEVLLGGYAAFERVAHLAPTPLPGGDAAVRHPARVALAQLWKAGLAWDGTHAARAIPDADRRILRTQLERSLNCATTTSMGRFLDAAASLAGGRQTVSYEGQGAIEFEALALAAAPGKAPYAFALRHDEHGTIVVDGAPVLRDVARDAASGRSIADIAWAVHAAIAECIVEVAVALRAARQVERVGLTGGVFQNALLLTLAVERLHSAGFTVMTHHLVPPNDGGLALGQAMVAAHSPIVA
jgi:hydrogenase maturation protein HypF